MCCLNLQNVFAQHVIEEKIKWYGLAKPTTNLFVHFDKNVYSNNETAYFTGYLIRAGRVRMSSHKVMALALVRDVDSALITDDKFIIKDGLSFGSITLPDSIPTGNYHFLAYTDKLVNGMPEVLFIQNITIKSSIEPSFKANVKLVDQGNAEIKSHNILVSTSTIDDRFLAKPARMSYSYGNINKSINTDASGQSMITLPLQTDLSDPNLYIKLKYGKDSTFINMALPQPKSKAYVKFYPEGGNLVNGLASNVAWEVKDQQNRPLALKAFLFKDQQAIDTIETGSTGIGKFILKPETGSTYTIALLHSNLVDSIYQLPKASMTGISLILPNAIANDTLKMNLGTTEKSQITLLLHNFREHFLTIPINVRNGNSILKLPLTDIPKGLTTLTILDSLNQPLAERLFFAHYDDAERLVISSDKEVYKQREKVHLKLNLKGEANALVSIASVQNNRLALGKINDIESYTYLNNELSTLPITNKRAYKDRNYLEEILLVKGWRRYTWRELQDSKPLATKFKFDSLTVSGKVSKLKKEISDSLVIGTMGSQYVSLINTTKNGSFTLNESALLTPASKKMYVLVNGAQKLSYIPKVSIIDEFLIKNRELAKVVHNGERKLPSNLMNNTELVLKTNEKSIQLNEVVITNKRDNGFMHSAYGPNACGDFVCRNQILNCNNHRGDKENTQPIKGRLYYYMAGGKLVYPGCTVPDQNIFTLVKGVHLEKEFYENDYKDPNEPAFFSTLYWNYGLVINSKKETELSFYTSDITGKFRIVVQGISNNDVVYGEHFFEVKEK